MSHLFLKSQDLLEMELLTRVIINSSSSSSILLYIVIFVFFSPEYDEIDVTYYASFLYVNMIP